MKSIKLTFAFAAIAFFAFSCKKNKDVPAPTFDYSKVKVKSKTHTASNYATTDTTRYTYTATGFTEINNSSNSTTVFKTEFAKTGNTYTGQSYNNNTLSVNWVNHLNAMGLADSSFGIRPNNTFNNKTYFKYDANGYNSDEVISYITYGYNNKKYYSNENIAYIISDFWQTTPLVSRRDSIVYETYTDKPLHVFYSYRLQEQYGKKQKNLTKKTSSYNTSNFNELRRTVEYEYETDANGLVTKETQRWYSHPGNVLILTDITTIEYYKD